MNWVVKAFNALNNSELYSILQLRSEVFVVEQNCAYQDMDGTDQKSLHLFGVENGNILAYARLIPPGISYEVASIGRVVVSPSIRKKGAGKELMKQAILETKTQFKTENITISAQEYLKSFYNELGFKESGDGYLEDNIPHIKMKL